jgi:hypothetical protein
MYLAIAPFIFIRNRVNNPTTERALLFPCWLLDDNPRVSKLQIYFKYSETPDVPLVEAFPWAEQLWIDIACNCEIRIPKHWSDSK